MTHHDLESNQPSGVDKSLSLLNTFSSVRTRSIAEEKHTFTLHWSGFSNMAAWLLSDNIIVRVTPANCHLMSPPSVIKA